MRSLSPKTFALFAVTLLFAAPLVAIADTLGISPTSGAYEVGRTFPVRITVSSSQSINAVSGTVSFPADKLQVVSISKTGSILTLWVAEPSFSNVSGMVSFEGVVPNPGYIGVGGGVITVNFKAIAPGSASIKFDSGTVLANDGNGTNILRNLGSASFSIGAGVVEVTPVAPVAPVPVQTTSGGPVVMSPTYPDSRVWYSETTGLFNWKVSDGTTATRILLGKLPTSQPTVVYDPPIESKEIDDIEDGIWYLHVQLRNGSTWGPITHYPFKVDSTPPETFVVKAIPSEDPTDPRPRFSFSATDVTSGVDYFTVQIDSGKAEKWEDSGSGVYRAPLLLPGKHTLLAKAYDGAGNLAASSVDFVVGSIPSPTITSYTESIKDNEPLLVRGTATPDTAVHVRLLKNGSTVPLVEKVESDEEGKFTATFDGDLEKGVYKLTAVAVDDRGAESSPSSTKTVLVKTSWISGFGSKLLTTLAVLVPALALLFFIWVISMHGFHRVRMTNRKFRSELHNIEHLVDQAFVLLKEDVEDSIRLLERTKSRRRLTAEEDAIIERLRQNLREAEKVIHGEVKKIEKNLD